MNQRVFVTDNVKIAAALTAAGFSIQQAQNTLEIPSKSEALAGKKERKRNIFELDSEHNGVSADYLGRAFKYDYRVDARELDLEARVNEIIELRGITQEEYVLLAFDAARAGLNNRGTIIYCLTTDKTLLIAKMLNDGRCIIYREGTPKAQLEKLIEGS